MSPRALGALQESILDGIKRQSDGAPDKAIAAHAGVDRTQLSKWRTGDRVMRLDELCGLLPAYGAAAVLGPIAALDEADVVERDPKGPADPRALSLSLNVQIAGLTSTVHMAFADNVVDPDELAAITQRVEQLVLDLRRLSAGAAA